MSIKSRVLFLGLGQCGGNIAKEFEDRGYQAFYINTSNFDLEELKTNRRNIYQIPNSSGCAGDRTKAIMYAKNYHKHITDILDTRFATFDIVFICGSLGGGTGSGLLPIVANLTTNTNPDKIYCSVIVFPSSQDSDYQIDANSLECIKQLQMVDNLKAIFPIDNNSSSDILEVNEKFADLLDSFLSITNANKRGVIDESEVEKMLSTKGVANIVKLKSLAEYQHEYIDKNLRDIPLIHFKSLLKEHLDKGVFTTLTPGPIYIGASLVDDINIQEIHSVFGKPSIRTFRGLNEEANIISAWGLPFPADKVRRLERNVEEHSKRAITKDDKLEINIKRIDREPKAEDKKESIDDIFNKFLDF